MLVLIFLSMQKDVHKIYLKDASLKATKISYDPHYQLTSKLLLLRFQISQYKQPKKKYSFLKKPIY